MHLYGLPPPPRTPLRPPQQRSQATASDIKAQGVRLLDVGLFGPLTILGALNKEPPGWMRLALLFYGIGTIAYNWRNWREIREREKKFDRSS